MDKIENADKEQNIPNTLDGFNLPGENDQIVASQNVIDETNRLYIYLLSGQMTSVGLRFPFEDREYLVVPRNASSLQSLANQFALSPQRKWVHEQAENVDLESLNFITFQQLMHGLLQEEGVTWERVLVLFYFCIDLSIRALQEKLVNYFIRIYNWTTCYLTRRLSVWIEQEGGWDAVLRTTVNYARNVSIISGICAISVILICLYIRSR